jgi:ABC-type Fe3+/spermidine/putrescine transport system ATPase subunit
MDTAMRNDAELIGVSKRYGSDELAVDAVSLQIRNGEFLSLLGPSGCGKSTTLRMLAGLETPTAGTILIAGQDMTRVPANRRPTNLIFQSLALFPHLTVAENIAFGPRLRRQSRADVQSVVAEMLELVELGGYADRRPAQLSGGQQQRVAIARALANRPKLLLLDEPLGALDFRLRVQMQRALKKIQHESRTTFVLVTHDQTEAFNVSDRIAVMHAGRIEQVGNPQELYTAPASEYVARFLGDINVIPGEVHDDRLVAGTMTVQVSGRGRAVGIRPESILVGAATSLQTDNVYRGRVNDLVFQGQSVRMLVDLPRENKQFVIQRSSHELTPFAIGDEVEIGWPIRAGVMLNATAGS